MVEGVEVAVCPKLAGEISDGKSARAVDRKYIIPWKICHVIFFAQDANAAVQNFLDEPKMFICAWILFENTKHDFMINTWKKLTSVTGEYEFETAGETLGAVEGFVSPFADAVGIRILDERSFENRFDEIAKCVVDDAVTKRRGGDQSYLWVVDVETVIFPRLITLVLQFVL